MIRLRTLSTALWCSVMPSVQQIMARSARANAWAASRIASAGTPVRRSPSSSVYSSTLAAYSSNPVVACSMKPRLCRPAWMISRAIVFERATSEPTSRPSQRSAHCAEDVRRGSTTTSRAPLCTPFRRWWKKIGMRLAGVRAPQEDDVRLLDLAVRRRPAACTEHRRQTDDARGVSGSVAGVDVVRAHHLTGELLREEVHLVRRLRAREHAERRGGVGGRARAASPAAARSSASSHVAVASVSPSRTSGVVIRPLNFLPISAPRLDNRRMPLAESIATKRRKLLADRCGLSSRAC